MGYYDTDWIECEVIDCKAQAVDIHHIECKGMGGSKQKDYIENLQALCRHHHLLLGDRKGFTDELKEAHEQRLIERNVNYSKSKLYVL